MTTVNQQTALMACTYASLILFDDDLEVTDDRIAKILKASDVQVDKYWPRLFSTTVKDKGLSQFLTDQCRGGGGSANAASSGDGGGIKDAPAQKPNEAKKVEAQKEDTPKASSKSGPGLFGGDGDSD